MSIQEPIRRTHVTIDLRLPVMLGAATSRIEAIAESDGRDTGSRHEEGPRGRPILGPNGCGR